MRFFAMMDSCFSANIQHSFYLCYLSEFWGVAQISTTASDSIVKRTRLLIQELEQELEQASAKEREEVFTLLRGLLETKKKSG
jgi:hypothetical protein